MKNISKMKFNSSTIVLSSSMQQHSCMTSTMSCGLGSPPC